MCNSISNFFFQNGFVLINANEKIFEDSFFCIMKRFTHLTGIDVSNKDFSDYHVWNKDDLLFNHQKVCEKSFRHFVDNNLVNSITNQKNVKEICNIFFKGKFRVWDEGLGNVAYRLIRPFGNDGYPLSKKTWGPGGNLLSISIPISCVDPKSGIGLVPKSHKKTYSSKRDSSGKFEEKELRFSGEISDLNIIRPMKMNHILVTHPDLLHCESVAEDCTYSRLSLEIRVCGS